MGTDIHIWVEIKERNGWELRLDPDQSYGVRDYGVFGILAGVRDDGPPIALPRGIPRDSFLALNDIEGDYHSWSWLKLSEILQHDDWPLRGSEKFLEWCRGLLTLPFYNDAERIRLVFGFDS